MSMGRLYVLLVEMPIQVPCPLFDWIIFWPLMVADLESQLAGLTDLLKSPKN